MRQMAGNEGQGVMKTNAFFEDFAVGDRWSTAGHTLTEGAIIDFAFRYDPQPFHIDLEAAQASIYGGLIASGFQTLAVTFRLVQQTAVLTNNIGGRGLDELRWPQAVRPGDTLRVEVEVVETRRSSLPDRGNLRLRYVTTNQRGETVLTATFLHVMKCRESAP